MLVTIPKRTLHGISFSPPGILRRPEAAYGRLDWTILSPSRRSVRTFRPALVICQTKRPARANPLLETDIAVQARRDSIETRLRAILNEIGQPFGFPVVLLDCERCREIHRIGRPCREARSGNAGPCRYSK